MANTLNKHKVNNTIQPEKINKDKLHNKLSNFLDKLTYSHVKFLKELSKENFDSNKADKILNSGKIDINHLSKNNQTFLHITLEKHKIKAANWLIDRGIGINILDSNNNIALTIAIKNRNHQIIKKLLSINNKPLNKKNSHGRTLLQNAVISGDHKTADILLELGADVNSKDNHGGNVIFDALSFGDEDFIYKLLDLDYLELNNLCVNKNTIMQQCEVIKNEELISYLIDRFVNSAKYLELSKAVATCDAELVTKLLNTGINPNIKYNNNKTLIYLAAIRGLKNIEIISLLLKFGVDTTTKDAHNKTIYEVLNEIILHTHHKREMQNDELVSALNPRGKYMHVLKKLLEYDNKSLELVDTSGNPLFFAPFYYEVMPLFKLYINHNHNVDAQNDQGHNLFFDYIYKTFQKENEPVHFKDNLKLLIDYKADCNFKDKTGWNVLNKVLSISKNNTLIKTLIDTISFDDYAKDALGRTTIHTCVWFDNNEIIQYLSDINSAIMNESDNYGILPITYSALLGNQKLVLLFLSLNSNMKGTKKILAGAVKKFGPMTKNLNKLYVNISNKDTLMKIDKLVVQIKGDFQSK